MRRWQGAGDKRDADYIFIIPLCYALSNRFRRTIHGPAPARCPCRIAAGIRSVRREASADKAEAAKRKGDPDWRAKGLSCDPKTRITAAQYQATCGRQPKPGLRYVCPC
jgi:hypothetical protein